MADPAMVSFLVEQLENFDRAQLYEHLRKDGHPPQAVEEALNEAEAFRAAPDRGFFGGRMSRTFFGIVFASVLAFDVLVLFLIPGLSKLLGFLSGIALMLAAIPRIHDFDHAGWWSLMMLAPPLNLALILGLLIVSGSPGRNKFGPPPS